MNSCLFSFIKIVFTQGGKRKLKLWLFVVKQVILFCTRWRILIDFDILENSENSVYSHYAFSLEIRSIQYLYLRIFYSWFLGAIKHISCSKTYFHCFICPTIKQITMKPGNFFKNKWENSKSWGLNEVWLEEIWLLWSSQQGYLVAERCVERRSFTLTCPSAAEKAGSKERRIYEEESS